MWEVIENVVKSPLFEIENCWVTGDLITDDLKSETFENQTL